MLQCQPQGTPTVGSREGALGGHCGLRLVTSGLRLSPMLPVPVVRPHPDSDGHAWFAGKGELGRGALSVPTWERIWFFGLVGSVLPHPEWPFGGGSNGV